MRRQSLGRLLDPVGEGGDSELGGGHAYLSGRVGAYALVSCGSHDSSCRTYYACSRWNLRLVCARHWPLGAAPIHNRSQPNSQHANRQPSATNSHSGTRPCPPQWRHIHVVRFRQHRTYPRDIARYPEWRIGRYCNAHDQHHLAYHAPIRTGRIASTQGSKHAPPLHPPRPHLLHRRSHRIVCYTGLDAVSAKHDDRESLWPVPRRLTSPHSASSA